MVWFVGWRRCEELSLGMCVVHVCVVVLVLVVDCGVGEMCGR